ncbi:MAG: hypothetical protein ACE5EO_02505 [Candidatus Krumholzibacteriia bacterium]
MARARTFTWALLLACAAVPPGTAVRVSAQIRILAVDSLRASLGSVAYSDRIKREWTSSRPLLRDNEAGLLESLRLGVGGSLYHPRLFSWTSSGRLTLKQRSLSNEQPDSHRAIGEALSEYRVAGMFLRDHDLSLTVAATRNVTNVDGDFLEDTYVNRSSRTAALRWGLRRLNQVLDYEWNNYDSKGLVENEEIRRALRYESTLRGERFYASAKYEVTENDFLTSGNDVENQTGRLLSTMRLDKAGRRTISSSVYYNRLQAAVSSRYVEGSVFANIGLLSNLDLTTSYSRRNDEVAGISSRTDAVGASLVHRLYRSVVTTITGDGTFPEYDDGRQLDAQVSARTDYRKQTFFGSLRLFYEYGFRRYKEDFSRNTSRPRQRTVVYTPGVPTVLDEVGVDSTSIEILNLTQPGVLPQQGIDYLIITTGDFFEIQIQPLATIQPGDELSIRYVVLVGASFEFEERAPAYGFGLGITPHISLDASRQKLNRDLLRGEPSATIENTRLENASLRLNWQSIRVEARYQNRVTTINPYKRSSASIYYVKPINGSLNLVVNSAYSETEFTEDRERSKNVTFAGTFWYRPTRRLVIETRFHGLQRSGRRDDGHDVTLGVNTRYVAHNLEVLLKLNAYNREVKIVGTEERTLASLEIRRHF